MCSKYCHVAQMARNTFNDKIDKMLGLANDIRNRTRRLLFHANLNANEDTKIDHILVNLQTSVATLLSPLKRTYTKMARRSC